MARHVDEIKNMIFDEPDFDNDDEKEIKSKKTRRKKLQKETTKSSVETIVFRDPAKKRKITDVSRHISVSCIDLFVSRNPKLQFRYLNPKNLILKKLVLMYINLVSKVLKKANMKMLVLH
jgi:hypothetical protein